MSVSSLPEWKQLLLERKRREEEEREMREKEEEKRLASMPAWKRGIIQRRRAKQEVSGDQESGREGSFLYMDGKPPSDTMSDTDSSIAVQLGSEPSLSPDITGTWQDKEAKAQSQVSTETIVPVHKNPFIRTQPGWKWGKETDEESSGDKGINQDNKEWKNKEKSDIRGQDTESGRVGRDVERKSARFRNRSEGRGRDRSTGRETNRDTQRERDCDIFKGRGEDEGTEKDSSSHFPPLVSGLRTICADNIIIIEQERKVSDEIWGRRRVSDRDDDGEQEKRGLKMGIREILAGGGSVTEIRASEVLIIKPSGGADDRMGGLKGTSRYGNEEREREIKCSREGVKEATDRDMGRGREKERENPRQRESPWHQCTTTRDSSKNNKSSTDDSAIVERGGRVIQMLSRFGEHRKPPSRSKSSECFIRPARSKELGHDDDDSCWEGKSEGQNVGFRGVPKRSFSFSDRVICSKENGALNEERKERKTVERTHSDRRAAPRGQGESNRKFGEKGSSRSVNDDWTTFSNKEQVRSRQDQNYNERETGGQKIVRQTDSGNESEHKLQVLARPKPAAKKADEFQRDECEGFTMASVQNTEGVSFARRVHIRLDGRAKGVEMVGKGHRECESERERALEGERDGLAARQKAESHAREREEYNHREGTLSPETHNCITASTDRTSPLHDSPCRHMSAFTECSSLLSTAVHRRETEWQSGGLGGHHPTHSPLSQHTEDLISKIERLGEVNSNSERAPKAYRATGEPRKENTSEKHDAHTYREVHSEMAEHDPRCPNLVVTVGLPSPTPLEIHIPRTVFYGVEEALERKRPSGHSDSRQDGEDGRGVERRDSWRTGKPLSRVESLREKIRQREWERLRNMERGWEAEGSENSVSPQRGVPDKRQEECGSDMQTEWEMAAHSVQEAESERGQEVCSRHTSTTFNVIQEVGLLQVGDQHPVPLCHTVRTEEEVKEETTRGIDVPKVVSTSSQTTEDGAINHVEELRHDRAWQRENHGREEEEEEEKEAFSKEVYPLLYSPSNSLSPSPLDQRSLAEMSRIYNLKTTGSRAALCVRDRAVNNYHSSPAHIPKTPSHLVPQQETSTVDTDSLRQLWTGGKPGDSLPSTSSNKIAEVQHEVEQLCLCEKEATGLSLEQGTQPKPQPRDGDTRGSLRELQHTEENHSNPQPREQANPRNSRLSSSVPQTVSQRAQSKQEQCYQPRCVAQPAQNPPFPESSLKTSDKGCPPTPTSSPCSTSPTQSPTLSPSPSPTLFSIRSASGGGQGRKGTTITINPRKTVGAGAVATSIGPSTKTIPQGKAPSIVETVQPVKKRYPTVEEIIVIGGYKNLERSCLVKGRGTPRRVKVCFNEDQLEQVCGYPSENSVLACTPPTPELSLGERRPGEVMQEEEEEERVECVSRTTRSVEATMGRVLRVDESCPR